MSIDWYSLIRLTLAVLFWVAVIWITVAALNGEFQGGSRPGRP